MNKDIKEFIKDSAEVLNSLYLLKISSDDEINAFFQKIKSVLIDTEEYSPERMIEIISKCAKHRNRYFKSYIKLSKKIYDEYHPKQVERVNSLFDYIFYKEYGFVLSEDTKNCFDIFESEGYSIEIHDKYSSYGAIMNNGDKLLSSIFVQDGFDKNQKLSSKFYPRHNLSFLEVCCYHGAVDCFKLLRSEFKAEVSETCIELSFLGGSQEIMMECLKVFTEDDKKKLSQDFMQYAIISHNIDFISYLINEYGMYIDIPACYDNNNIQAFIVHLDYITDINDCLYPSILFDNPFVCEYMIHLGADIQVNIDPFGSPLQYALNKGCYASAKYLISKGSDIEVVDDKGRTYLIIASVNNYQERVRGAVLCGANINKKDLSGKTALHYSVDVRNEKTVEFLISHGADVNARDNSDITPLSIAKTLGETKIEQILLSHDAKI